MPSRDAPIRLELLGGIDLRGIDRTQADALLAQPKLTALLAFLALAPDARLQRRDRVVGLLWPELDQARARAALRKALHAVRSALGTNALRARGDEEIGLDPDVVGCDAAELRSAADSGALLRAVEIGRGELMPGFHLAGCAEFGQWLDAERAEMRELGAAAAWAMARRFEEDRELTDAASMARKAARYSFDDERILRRTMTMLMRLGDRAGALALYQEFARRMRTDLGADPSAETTRLADTLRTQG
ncbi:MAG TPA: BTAD domain-containing putative transcriptional regulator [Gemmatimonadaceae bacterium]|nr:BTAD domain-containing putative transcriptional regulator [Gemmatimonadaceae bacterium]